MGKAETAEAAVFNSLHRFLSTSGYKVPPHAGKDVTTGIARADSWAHACPGGYTTKY